MRRAVLLTFLFALGAAVFFLCRHLAEQYPPAPTDVPSELAWLVAEFRLDDEQRRTIAKLHGEYIPRCEALCRRIEMNQKQLSEALTQRPDGDAEIGALLREAAQIQVECRTAMLQHFRQVAAVMNAEDGRRYLSYGKAMVVQAGLPGTGSVVLHHD